MGVPKSKTPVPKMDCSKDVNAIVNNISRSTVITFIFPN
jgi:hypothetical protein